MLRCRRQQILLPTHIPIPPAPRFPSSLEDFYQAMPVRPTSFEQVAYEVARRHIATTARYRSMGWMHEDDEAVRATTWAQMRLIVEEVINDFHDRCIREEEEEVINDFSLNRTKSRTRWPTQSDPLDISRSSSVLFKAPQPLFDMPFSLHPIEPAQSASEGGRRRQLAQDLDPSHAPWPVMDDPEALRPRPKPLFTKAISLWHSAL